MANANTLPEVTLSITVPFHAVQDAALAEYIPDIISDAVLNAASEFIDEQLRLDEDIPSLTLSEIIQEEHCMALIAEDQPQ